MAEEQKKMVPTLGLTGVTVNAMALIAPGAFLWITFVVQAGYAYPSGLAMWAGIFAALMLAYATAISYSELAKLYPGCGQFVSLCRAGVPRQDQRYRFARIAKFTIGWASHLYYWVYPGVMVATMGVMIGYIVGSDRALDDERGCSRPGFHGADCDRFLVRGRMDRVSGRQRFDNVNIAINANPDRRAAVLSALAIAYRLGHPDGSTGLALDGTAERCCTTHRPAIARLIASALSVILPHNFNWVMLQATVAILLLVGFESVTSLGEEALNPKKDIPRGVMLSLTIQCLFCYLIEYFAANYFLNSAYSLADAKGSAAPIGDMMVIIGNALLGGHGRRSC